MHKFTQNIWLFIEYLFYINENFFNKINKSYRYVAV